MAEISLFKRTILSYCVIYKKVLWYNRIRSRARLLLSKRCFNEHIFRRKHQKFTQSKRINAGKNCQLYRFIISNHHQKGKIVELSQSKNQIIIKRNTTFLGIGIFAILMEASGIQLIFELLPFEEGVLLNNYLL